VSMGFTPIMKTQDYFVAAKTTRKTIHTISSVTAAASRHFCKAVGFDGCGIGPLRRAAPFSRHFVSADAK